MRITFFDPPNWLGKDNFERVFGCTHTIFPFPNIFALQCAALLNQSGFSAKYVDAATENWGKEKFLAFLVDDSSQRYIFYSVNLSTESDLLSLKLIRSVKPEVPVIFIGPAPTYFPEKFLVDKHCFVVRGEPEFSLLELMQAIHSGKSVSTVLGVSYYSGKKSIHNNSRHIVENLDQLPFPDRSLLKRDLYSSPKLGEKPWTVMLTSRGCSHRCIYCVPNSLSFARELEFKSKSKGKPPVRVRDAEQVIEEFRQLARDGYKAISIIDDQFVWGKERTLKICEAIAGLSIKWGCLSRADHLDDEILKAMAKAGCKYIDIGVESFNQNVLDYVKKDLDVEAIYNKIALIKKHGIDVKLNMLLGACPTESKQSIRDSISKAIALKPSNIMFSVVCPFPGTEFYEECQKNGWLKNSTYNPIDVQKEAITNFPGMSSQELDVMVKKANYRFFFSPRFVLSNAKKLASTRSLSTVAKAIKRKLTF